MFYNHFRVDQFYVCENVTICNNSIALFLVHKHSFVYIGAEVVPFLNKKTRYTIFL